MSNEQVLANFSRTREQGHGLLILNTKAVLKFLAHLAPVKSGDISDRFAELALEEATDRTYDNVVVLGSASDAEFLDFTGMVSGDLNYAIYDVEFMDILQKQVIVRRVQ